MRLILLTLVAAAALSAFLPAAAAAEEQVDVVFRDDSGTLWIRLPDQPAPMANNFLTINARRLGRDPAYTEAAASRTMTTLSEVASDYNWTTVSRVVRNLNETQAKTYHYLDGWHQRLLADNNLKVQRRRDEVGGGYLYIFGYHTPF